MYIKEDFSSLRQSNVTDNFLQSWDSWITEYVDLLIPRNTDCMKYVIMRMEIFWSIWNLSILIKIFERNQWLLGVKTVIRIVSIGVSDIRSGLWVLTGIYKLVWHDQWTSIHIVLWRIVFAMNDSPRNSRKLTTRTVSDIGIVIPDEVAEW